jgi:hypothetical protein
MARQVENTRIPDWITKRELEKTAEEDKAKEISRQQFEASKLVQQGGREFWQQLLNRLKINTDALQRLGDELYGSTSPMGDPAGGGEVSCHIQVDRRSVRLGPELSQMNLFYQPGGHRIRRWYQNRPLDDIELRPSQEGVVAVVDESIPMTSEELADSLVQSMAERVRR